MDYTEPMEQGEPKTVWECRWWRVEERAFRGPDGKERRWYTARRPNPNTVHMLGVTPDGLVPLLRQWRIPVQDWVWELPAGLCDVEEEEIADTARRELEEETGYRAGEVQHLFTGTVSPGLSDELYNAFLCLDLEKVDEGGGTGSERIEVHLVPLKELGTKLLDAAAEGQLVDSKILTHLSLAMHRLVLLAHSGARDLPFGTNGDNEDSE